jgi:hypothetical protein
MIGHPARCDEGNETPAAQQERFFFFSRRANWLGALSSEDVHKDLAITSLSPPFYASPGWALIATVNLYGRRTLSNYLTS